MRGAVLMRGDRPDILWLDKDPRTLCTTWDRFHGASQWPGNPAGWLGKAENMRGTFDSSWFYSNTDAARPSLLLPSPRPP